MADVKYILLDIDAAVRALGGCKKVLNTDNLPSVRHKNKITLEEVKNETEEERLERHKKFFSELKTMFSNK